VDKHAGKIFTDSVYFLFQDLSDCTADVEKAWRCWNELYLHISRFVNNDTWCTLLKSDLWKTTSICIKYGLIHKNNLEGSSITSMLEIEQSKVQVRTPILC